MFSSLIWTLPVVYEDDDDVYWSRTIVSVWFFIQVWVNFGFVYTNRGFYTQETCGKLGVIPDPSWSKCLDCDQLIPPRAHHCVLCQKCVLRRDHHCFFTGTCVGYANQRYFLVFTFYCAVAALYAFYVTWSYVVMMYAPPYPISSQFYHYLIPITVIEWLCGYASFSFMYFVLLGYLAAMTGFGSLGIFAWQFFTVVQGITTNEFWKASSAYKSSMLQNLRGVFGPYWLLNFIIPMPFFKTPGNGVEWNTSKHAWVVLLTSSIEIPWQMTAHEVTLPWNHVLVYICILYQYCSYIMYSLNYYSVLLQTYW